MQNGQSVFLASLPSLSHSVLSLVPDLLFDCSRVLEYAKYGLFCSLVEQYQGNYLNNLKVSRVAVHYAYFSVLVIYFLYRTGTIRYKWKFINRTLPIFVHWVARYSLKARVTREREGELRAPEFIGLIIAYTVIWKLRTGYLFSCKCDRHFRE